MKVQNQVAQLKVNEIFESIQGEGKYIGCPALFIRLSGCNRNCDFCDTKYHTSGKEYDIKKIVDIINKSDKEIVIWTGGEPTIQLSLILKVIKQTNKHHHLETNTFRLDSRLLYFDYISFSPKDLKDCKRLKDFLKYADLVYDIKIVTDLKNKEMLKYATILMPLSTYDKNHDKIAKKVWDYCVEHNYKYSGRLHILWGRQRAV